MLRRFAPVVLLVLALGVPSFPAADALAADKLVVWWNKGYYPEEDAAMQKIVKEFEAQTMHIHYWRDLLREVGMADDPAKVPMKWDDYWTYWKKAQDALRKKDPAKYGKLYGLGMTESTRASDTLYNFEMALLSFNGETVDKDGKVVADQPKNREAIIKTLNWFGELFTSGYVPPDATNWTDGDNNAGFHSRTIVMTPNPSQSIPAFPDVAAGPFGRTGPKGPKCQKDMHVPVATTIFLDRENKVFEHYKNPAFSQLYDENVWGKAMARIAIDKWSADRAADEAIERMKAIFAGYK